MYKDYYWLNEDSRTFLERDYLEKNITPEQRVRQIAKTAQKFLLQEYEKANEGRHYNDSPNFQYIDKFADKFESYMKKGWYSLSTPIWTNFGNKRGLPISCFGAYIPDTMEGILEKLAEVGIESKIGGGTSAYFGDLRARGATISAGGASSGPVHFMELFDTVANVVSQGSARRGSFVAYLPVEHPDILEFLQIRNEGHPIQNMSIGVCISDKWMEEMVNGDKNKRKIWGVIIKKRFESGYPYIFFSDTVNKNAPQVYKDKQLTIHASNLCSEICLSATSDESFVCNLSSMNLLHYEDWKDTDAVETLTYFLDAVMTEFIEKSGKLKFMEAPHKFAVSQRALGLGVLGWHSYLQDKMISFESMEAKMKNVEIFKFLQQKTILASQQMASIFGEPSLLKGYGLRNATLITLPPTTSSSFVLGQASQSIELLNSNYFTKNLAKGKFTYKNPKLKEVLKKYDKNDSETWKSILVKGGSVQHLNFLTKEEKDVFKTFGETSQKEVVIQAAQRQRYIDQSQSLNLMIPPNTKPKDVSELLIEGWRLGIKTFYYQRSSNPSQDLARSILTCASCEA